MHFIHMLTLNGHYSVYIPGFQQVFEERDDRPRRRDECTTCGIGSIEGGGPEPGCLRIERRHGATRREEHRHEIPSVAVGRIAGSPWISGPRLAGPLDRFVSRHSSVGETTSSKNCPDPPSLANAEPIGLELELLFGYAPSLPANAGCGSTNRGPAGGAVTDQCPLLSWS